MEHKYKVGDRVRIVSDWKNCRGLEEPWGGMDHWLGKVMTIRAIIDPYTYRMLEDKDEHRGHGWYWYDCMIVGLAMPAGTKFLVNNIEVELWSKDAETSPATQLTRIELWPGDMNDV